MKEALKEVKERAIGAIQIKGWHFSARKLKLGTSPIWGLQVLFIYFNLMILLNSALVYACQVPNKWRNIFVLIWLVSYCCFVFKILAWDLDLDSHWSGSSLDVIIQSLCLTNLQGCSEDSLNLSEASLIWRINLGHVHVGSVQWGLLLNYIWKRQPMQNAAAWVVLEICYMEYIALHFWIWTALQFVSNSGKNPFHF